MRMRDSLARATNILLSTLTHAHHTLSPPRVRDTREREIGGEEKRSERRRRREREQVKEKREKNTPTILLLLYTFPTLYLTSRLQLPHHPTTTPTKDSCVPLQKGGKGRGQPAVKQVIRAPFCFWFSLCLLVGCVPEHEIQADRFSASGRKCPSSRSKSYGVPLMPAHACSLVWRGTLRIFFESEGVFAHGLERDRTVFLVII